jgi:hypothetical protein
MTDMAAAAKPTIRLNCVDLFRKFVSLFPVIPWIFALQLINALLDVRSDAPSTGSAKGRLDAIARSSVGRDCHTTPRSAIAMITRR